MATNFSGEPLSGVWLGRLCIQKAAGICKHVARLRGSILAVPDSMSQLGIPMTDVAHLLPVADDSPPSHVTVPIVQSNSRRSSSSSTHRVSLNLASDSQLPRRTLNGHQPPSRFPVKAKVLNPSGTELDLRRRAPLRSRAPFQVILEKIVQICAPLRSRRKTIICCCCSMLLLTARARQTNGLFKSTQ